MKVADIRKLLENVPDTTEVVTYAEIGTHTYDPVQMCKLAQVSRVHHKHLTYFNSNPHGEETVVVLG